MRPKDKVAIITGGAHGMGAAEATPSAEKTEFLRLRKEQGHNVALAWRDGRFSDGQKS